MDIVQKYCNGYKITYMGDEDIKILNKTLTPHIQYFATESEMAIILNSIPIDEIDSFIYEEIILGSISEGWL